MEQNTNCYLSLANAVTLTDNANVHQVIQGSIVSPLVSPSPVILKWYGSTFEECGSLADGKERHPRPEGEQCQCKEGWTGINCNVCETDAACTNFPLRGGPDGELLTRVDTVDTGVDVPVANMTCYKGGETVEQNFQMCDVTSEFTCLDSFELQLKWPQIARF